MLSLQRMMGNRAVSQLLQRDPTNAARLSKIAKELRADQTLKGVGIDENDVHTAPRVREDKDDGVRPGLNTVSGLGARGRTGFVGDDGKYIGDFLPVTLDGPVPHVAVMLGPLPFTEGDDGLRSTLRHELKHAEHAQMLVDWLVKWRDAVKKTSVKPRSAAAAQANFLAWAGRQKLSPVDLALVRGGTAGATANPANTELLAHIEGFAAVFERTPPPSASVILKSTLPPAIEQLRGAAEHGWARSDEAVKTAAKDRLTEIYKQLSRDKQDLFRDWLFYLHYRATTEWPKGAADDDAKAARIVFHVFKPHVGFLESLLKLVGGLQRASVTIPKPEQKSPVTVKGDPTPKRTVKVRAGTVKLYTGISYSLRGGSRSNARDHGISLRYEGADAPEMRWLQFIWREVVTDQDKRVPGTVRHQTAEYPLTTSTEPSQIGWNTDTAWYGRGPQSAFYELENTLNRTPESLQMFDEPAPPYDEFVRAAFAGQPAPKAVTGRAHLVEYLIKDTEVLFRAEFVVEYKYKQPTDKPDAEPKLVSAQLAGAIDPGARARLHQQFKELDYIP